MAEVNRPIGDGLLPVNFTGRCLKLGRVASVQGFVKITNKNQMKFQHLHNSKTRNV